MNLIRFPINQRCTSSFMRNHMLRYELKHINEGTILEGPRIPTGFSWSLNFDLKRKEVLGLVTGSNRQPDDCILTCILDALLSF